MGENTSICVVSCELRGLYSGQPLCDKDALGRSADASAAGICLVRATWLVVSAFLLAGCSDADTAASATGAVAKPLQNQQASDIPENGGVDVDEPLESRGYAEKTTPAAGTRPTPELDKDDHYRQGVVGTWEDDYAGHRVMTLHEDGTGTMVVELSGWKATLFASRLEFSMRWRVEGARLQKETIDGKPEAAVNTILKMMGNSVNQPIVELTEQQLVLLDEDGKTKYTWRRVEEGASG